MRRTLPIKHYQMHHHLARSITVSTIYAHVQCSSMCFDECQCESLTLFYRVIFSFCVTLASAFTSPRSHARDARAM